MPPLRVDLDGFAFERLEGEARRQGVTIDQLVKHALMYYIADLDSGRIARKSLEFPEDPSRADEV